MAQVSSDSSFWSEKWFSSFPVMPVRVNSVDSLDPVQLSFSVLGWNYFILLWWVRYGSPEDELVGEP